MAKLCVPNVIKGVNMQVYNFLMRLNETRNVLWHESCKCLCKLNSSICNNKQIWNSDTCRCDCNEDFAGIISCAKGYTWNPSICKCQCDKWCKPGQYLDHKNLLVYFQWLHLLELFVFVCLLILSGLKVKINMLIIKMFNI